MLWGSCQDPPCSWVWGKGVGSRAEAQELKFPWHSLPGWHPDWFLCWSRSRETLRARKCLTLFAVNTTLPPSPKTPEFYSRWDGHQPQNFLSSPSIHSTKGWFYWSAERIWTMGPKKADLQWRPLRDALVALTPLLSSSFTNKGMLTIRPWIFHVVLLLDKNLNLEANRILHVFNVFIFSTWHFCTVESMRDSIYILEVSVWPSVAWVTFLLVIGCAKRIVLYWVLFFNLLL